MAHEGRGDIDQEKKGRPGHQTADTEQQAHNLNNLTADRAGCRGRRCAVRHLPPACLLYCTQQEDVRVDNNRERSGMNVYPLHRG